MCDKVLCDKVVCGKVVCDKVVCVCEKDGVCVKDGYTGVCDKVMCDKGGDKDGVPESCV